MNGVGMSHPALACGVWIRWLVTPFSSSTRRRPEAIRAAPYFITTKDRHPLTTHGVRQDPTAAVFLRKADLEAIGLETDLRRQGIRFRRVEFLDWVLLDSFSRPFW